MHVLVSTAIPKSTANNCRFWLWMNLQHCWALFGANLTHNYVIHCLRNPLPLLNCAEHSKATQSCYQFATQRGMAIWQGEENGGTNEPVQGWLKVVQSVLKETLAGVKDEDNKLPGRLIREVRYQYISMFGSSQVHVTWLLSRLCMYT